MPKNIISNRWKMLLVFLAAVLLFLTLGGAWFYRLSHRAIIDENNYILWIEPGSNMRAVAVKIGRSTEIPAWAFELLGRVQGRASRIKAGEYHIPKGASAVELLDITVAGRSIRHNFTIVEGWRIEDLLAAIRQNPYLDSADKKLSPEELMRYVSMRDYPSVEGLFLPETYAFERGLASSQLFERSHQAMMKILNTAWERRASGLPARSPYEALIVASIVEKETSVADERPMISGIIYRRLERGMRLQMDVTVDYARGYAAKGSITQKDLRDPNPYNTYVVRGLPPAPIALPGKDSIMAALHPMDETTLYFVARGDGTHEFSTTLKEHLQAVCRYQKRCGG